MSPESVGEDEQMPYVHKDREHLTRRWPWPGPGLSGIDVLMVSSDWALSANQSSEFVDG